MRRTPTQPWRQKMTEFGRPFRILRASRERGSQGIQFAALGLVLLLAIFGILQASLYYITDLQASAAAQIGVQAARGQEGTAGAGIAAAETNIGRLGIARDVSVTGSRSVDDVQITVTANSPVLVPLLPLPAVVATAHGVVEHPTR